MRLLTFEQIQAMNGNGSSMRTILKHFIDKGASVYLLHEHIAKNTERYFLVDYDGLKIPLRSYNLSFFSIYNSHLGRTITSNKLSSYQMLVNWDISTPDTQKYSDMPSAVDFMSKHPQVVIKPRTGTGGAGITTGIRTEKELQTAVVQAQLVDEEVLIQQQVEGEDYRLLFIDYKFVAAVKRVPATITGDGKRSVLQLIKDSNAEISMLWSNIRKGITGADITLGSISKTPIKEVISARGKDFLEHIPARGEDLQVVDKANVSLGGQTHDVTDIVNKDLTDKLSAILRNIAMPLCGIDVLSTDIVNTSDNQASYVIELNGAPGLRLHELPAKGQPRQVCSLLTESLIKHYRQIQSS
jgi:cyanophycin synthetase